jgi:hypothetical protein
MPPILDLAIGVVFTFLLFSLVVSALNELILSWLDKRADFLEEGLAELLADPNKLSGGPLEQFLKHGLVDGLSRKADGKPGKPAYVPPGVFVLALLDQISKATPDKTRTTDDIKSALKALPESKLKQSLTAVLDEAGQNLEKFKAGLEDWFNQGMARVSGWYKRYAQQWMLWLGLVLAVGCNVDTIHIIQALSSDPKLRTSIVNQAIDYVNKNSTQATNAPMATGTPNASQAAADSKQLMSQVHAVEGSFVRMNATGLPVGWGGAQLAYFKDENGNWLASRISLGLFGWLLTALAGSLGAPFWFDTLNRFINIRGNGRAPEEGDPTNPKPKSLPNPAAAGP